MSQQTRLEVVVPRYTDWVSRWPDPASLAAESEEEVLAAWAGLGYYSRARNLHASAKHVAGSGWPTDAAGLRALPGVGAYTAAAVASLAWGEQVAMVDGNVIRVLSRMFAVSGDPRSGPGARRIAELSRGWIAGHDAGLVNEATMELGALVCTPRAPDCVDCPLAADCLAALDGEPERFPTARTRTETVEVRADVAVVVSGRSILLRTAAQGELLAGLWTIPALPLLPEPWRAVAIPHGTVRHAITHHRILWTVHLLKLPEGETRTPPGTSWCERSNLGTLLVSSLPRKVLARAGIAV